MFGAPPGGRSVAVESPVAPQRTELGRRRPRPTQVGDLAPERGAVGHEGVRVRPLDDGGADVEVGVVGRVVGGVAVVRHGAEGDTPLLLLLLLEVAVVDLEVLLLHRFAEGELLRVPDFCN